MPSYAVLFAAMALGAVWLARPTARARGRRGGAVLARLADGMAADVPHPARHAGGALGVRAQLAAAARLDRPVPRRHGGDGRGRRLGLAGPRRRGRHVRPDVDRQGGALGVGRLHLGQGRLHVGRHGGLPAGRRRGGDPRHPGLGHLALGRHRLDAGRGLLRAAASCGATGTIRARGPCRRSSASPSWPARCSTSTPSRRTRRCRSTSWPG